MLSYKKKIIDFHCMCSAGRINGRTGRTRKCISQSSELSASSVASLSGDQSSLGLLQAMLGQVEADLDTLSPDTAPGSAQSPKRHRTQGLTGFSVALISTLGRFVHHLKQVQQQINGVFIHLSYRLMVYCTFCTFNVHGQGKKEIGSSQSHLGLYFCLYCV